MIAQSFGLSTAVISGSAGTAEYMSAIKTAVMPVVEEYQAALDRALLLESEKQAGYYFVLDAGELLKGDAVSRFNAYAVALQNNIMSIDEVRYRENLPPLDFNYMKLSLADVLYNPISGEIITPNTGLTQDAKSGLTAPPQGCIIEEETRKKDNWVKGDKGLFAGSVPYASRVKLAKGEYKKITSEISTNYSKYAGKEICYHPSLWRDKYYTYEFINNGFGDYLFTDKRRD